jgi:hypothetical protein
MKSSVDDPVDSVPIRRDDGPTFARASRSPRTTRSGEDLFNALGLMRLLIGLGVGVGLVIVGLAAARMRKERQVESIWHSLEGGRDGERFQPDMVDSLPEPARRYLLHSIRPGTPLAASVRLVLTGSIRLMKDRDPLPMTSEEILAPPRGYIWKARVHQGVMRIRGFDLLADGRGEMRWWLGGLIPIVRASGAGLSRSAIGRLLGEAVFLPSVLLPSRGARWEAVDDSTARVRVSSQGEEVALTLTIDGEGRLRRVSFTRWNNDPQNGPIGYLPFVSEDFAAERTFDGYTIPTRFRAGWRLGQEGALAFFFATIAEAEFR